MKKEINYKLISFILAGAIILVAIVFGVMYYSNAQLMKGVAIGQEQAVVGVLSTVQQTGSVVLNYNNISVTLVPSQSLQLVQERTILQIMDLVKKEGFVSLYDNETQMVLVPYTEGSGNITG